MNKKIGKKIVKTISIEPYNQECIVIVNGTFGDAIKLFKKYSKNLNANSTYKWLQEHENENELNPKYHPTNGAFLYTELPNGYVMMFNHDKDDWVETVGNVVHESMHLTHYILRNARLPLTEESEEAYTYLTENIVEKILRIIY